MAYRTTRWRLLPGSKTKARQIAQCVGACRWAWNHFLDLNKQGMKAFKEGGGKKPFISLRAMNREFSELRRNTPWLKELPCHPVRHVLKYQDDAWKRAFAGKGFPQFRARGRDRDASVTFPPLSFQVRGDKLYLARIGWMEISRRGGNPYEGYPVKQVVVKPNCGKWYAVLFHDVPDEVAAMKILKNDSDTSVSPVLTTASRIVGGDVLVASLRRAPCPAEKQSELCSRTKLISARVSSKVVYTRYWRALFAPLDCLISKVFRRI